MTTKHKIKEPHESTPTNRVDDINKGGNAPDKLASVSVENNLNETIMEETIVTDTQVSTISANIDFDVLDHLLSLAQHHQSEGDLRQATEICLELVKDHPDTLQAVVAKAMLLDFANIFEKSDEMHMARAIYEHLLDMED